MPEIEARLDRVEGRLELAKLEINGEGMRDDIKQIAEGHIATQDLINRRADEIIAKLSERFEPVEAAVRHHSAVLHHHNLTAGSGH